MYLNANDACKGGSHQSTVQGGFRQAPCEEVDVVDVSVSPPQSLDHGGRDLAAEPLKVVSPGEFRMSLNENLADISQTLSCTNPSTTE